MGVSGIRTVQLTVPGTLAGDVDETEKSRRVSQSENTSYSEKIIEELNDKYNSENTKKTKPQLNGKQSFKQCDDKKSTKRMSISELFSQLSDDLLSDQIKNSDVNSNINNLLKNIWSSQKESKLDKDVISYFNRLSGCIDKVSDYYFSIVNDQSTNYDDIRLFFFGSKNINFTDKNEFLAAFNKKINSDNILKVMSDNAGDCKDKTSLLVKLLSDIINLPKAKDQAWIIEPRELTELESELNILHSLAENLTSARECLAAAQALVNMNNKNTIEYNNSLSVLMGKLADLRDRIAQKKNGE